MKKGREKEGGKKGESEGERRKGRRQEGGRELGKEGKIIAKFCGEMWCISNLLQYFLQLKGGPPFPILVFH